MSARPIATLVWDPPADWLCWAPSDPQTARREAVELADDRYALALVAAVDAFQELIEREVPGTAAAALWVPDTTTREPLATAALRLTSADDDERWSTERTLEFARSSATAVRGARVLDATAVPACTPAGDGVLRTVDSIRRLSRRVTREWTWYVLPPGTDETIMLQAQCTYAGLFDEVAAALSVIVESIVVTLELA